MSYDENKKNNLDNELMSMDIIDEPLLIVLDEDDYDEYENFDSITTTTTSLNHTEEQTKIEVKNLIESLSIESNTKSKNFPYSSKSSEKSNKSLRTIVIDTSFVQHSRRTKSISKRKNMSTSNNVSIDSVLSCISFDKVSNILTVSRMGSIYYCVEDLYIKIFSSLCTLDEFTNLLLKPQIIIVKQVTLSEKISIEQQSPKLKQFSQVRYRLISIDSSDYLIKLKQLLLINKNNVHIEKIIDEMRSYKQTSTSLLQDKVSTKRISTDDVGQQQKHFQIDQTEVGIFIECNNYSKNETPIDKLTETSLIESEICSTPINTNNLSSTEISLSRLYRSKSLIYNNERIKKRSSRSYSLPSIKFDIEKNKMLRFQSKIPKSIDLIDDNYSMPMIVNVEENVQHNNKKFRSYGEPPSYAQSLNNTNSSVSQSNSLAYPYLYRSSSLYLTPVRTPYNIYYQGSCPSRSSYQKPNESSSNHNDIKKKTPSPIIMSILEKPIFHNALKSEQQTLTKPCHLPCCSTDQSSSSKDIHSNERMIYQQYPPPFNRSNSKSPSSINLKQHRIRLTPYTLTKTYFAPLSDHHPSPQNSSINETTHKTNVHHSKRPAPNNLRLPYSSTRSINLSQAIIEHQHCDMDKIPKLVVRHTKAYLNKTIDTMGQLFPTWFNEPDYRCIHCFTCDQVFTPQLFMTHVDDEQLTNEQLLNMSSIQLLTSEKMSEYKVDLWNQFCTNLTIYAKEGRIIGFLPNKNF